MISLWSTQLSARVAQWVR